MVLSNQPLPSSNFGFFLFFIKLLVQQVVSVVNGGSPIKGNINKHGLATALQSTHVVLHIDAFDGPTGHTVKSHLFIHTWVSHIYMHTSTQEQCWSARGPTC